MRIRSPTYVTIKFYSFVEIVKPVWALFKYNSLGWDEKKDFKYRGHAKARQHQFRCYMQFTQTIIFINYTSVDQDREQLIADRAFLLESVPSYVMFKDVLAIYRTVLTKAE